jgi:NAD(P)H-hydrate epimerase
MQSVSREAMRELDRRAVREFGIPGLILMENAGRGAADVACSLLSGRPSPVVVVCGKGNNGGDGFVVARHLHNRGHLARIFYLGDLAAIPEGTDPHVNAGIARRMGLPLEEVRDGGDVGSLRDALDGADLVVDAIFGTGLTGEVRGIGRSAIEVILEAGRPVLAIDIPSGIDGNEGTVLGVAVRATATATFAAAKHGLVRGAGPEHAGEIHVVEISIPRVLLEPDPEVSAG